MITVLVLMTFYDENGLHKAGSITKVKESDFNPDYMKKLNPPSPGGSTELSELDDVDISGVTDGEILKYDAASEKWVNSTGGGSGSVITNIFDDGEGHVESMDIDGTNYEFGTGETTIDLSSIQTDSNGKVSEMSIDGTTYEFGTGNSTIENISTQGPNGEVDSMDIDGQNYTFATGGGGAAELNDLDDVNITNVDNADILSFDAINGKWINVHSDGYKIYCKGHDAPTNFSSTQLTDVRFERSGSSLNPQDVDRAITRVGTYGAAICLTYIFMNNYYTYAFKCIDKDKNVIFESEIFDNNGTKYVSQIVFSFDHQGLYAVGNTFALSSGGGGSALIVTLTGATSATVDLMNMSAQSSVNVNANKTYAEIKAADEIIFKITDNVSSGGARWTFRPVGMYTLDVQADQALVFTLSAYAANQTLKEFRLEISPWGTFFTLYCMA